MKPIEFLAAQAAAWYFHQFDERGLVVSSEHFTR
jgi:hypothetical protein